MRASILLLLVGASFLAGATVRCAFAAEPASPNREASPSNPTSDSKAVNVQPVPQTSTAKATERVFAFSYLGAIDRPIFPTIVGNSDVALKDFLAAHPKDELLPKGTKVVLAQEAFGRVASAVKAGESRTKDSGEPTLGICDWSPSGERTLKLAAKPGLELLRATDDCLKKANANPSGSLDVLISMLSQ